MSSNPPISNKLSPADFAAKLRSKFPGQYDDIDDLKLTRRTLSKHPQYKDMVDLPDLDKPLDITTIESEAKKFGLSISSGKRSIQHNKAVGGAANSYHLDDLARDFVGSRQKEFYDYMRDTYGGRMAESLDEGDHIHIASEATSSPLVSDTSSSNNRLTAGLLALNPITAGLSPKFLEGMNVRNETPRGTTITKKSKPLIPYQPSDYENQLANQFEQFKSSNNIPEANRIGLELQKKGWEFGSTRDDLNREWPYIKPPQFKDQGSIENQYTTYKGTEGFINQLEGEKELKKKQEEFARTDQRSVPRKFIEGLSIGARQTLDEMAAGGLKVAHDILSAPTNLIDETGNAIRNLVTSQQYKDELARKEKPVIKPIDQNILQKGTGYFEKRASEAAEEQELKGQDIASKAGHTIGGLAPFFIPGGGQVGFGIESGLAAYGQGQPLDKAILTGLMTVKGAQAASRLSGVLESEVAPFVAKELTSLAKNPSLAYKAGAATKNVIETAKSIPFRLEPYGARVMGQAIGLPLIQAGTGGGVPITPEDIGHTIVMALGFGLSKHPLEPVTKDGKPVLIKKGTEPKPVINEAEQAKAVAAIEQGVKDGWDQEVLEATVNSLKEIGALTKDYTIPATPETVTPESIITEPTKPVTKPEPIIDIDITKDDKSILRKVNSLLKKGVTPDAINEYLEQKGAKIRFGLTNEVIRQPKIETPNLEQVPAPEAFQPSEEVWNQITSANPTEPIGLEEKPQVSNKQELAKALVEKWKYQPMWATATSEIADARARTWAKETGKPIEEWYHTRLSKVGDYQDFISMFGDPAELAKAQGYEGNVDLNAVSTNVGGKGLMFALKSPSKSSAVHELAHIFRWMDLEGENLRVAEEWLGVKDGKWDVEHEERFARGFEGYLATGEAPTPQLKKVFDYFKKWMVEIYSAITNVPKGDNPLKVEISPEVREMFDSLLGKEKDQSLVKSTKGEVSKPSIELTPEGVRTKLGDLVYGSFTKEGLKNQLGLPEEIPTEELVNAGLIQKAKNGHWEFTKEVVGEVKNITPKSNLPKSDDGQLVIEPTKTGGYRVKNISNGLYTSTVKTVEEALARLELELEKNPSRATLEYEGNGKVAFHSQQGPNPETPQEGPESAQERSDLSDIGQGEKPPTAGKPASPVAPPEGMKERSLPKTLEEHNLPGGENLYYKEAPNQQTLDKANNIITDKGIDGAAEWVKSADTINPEHTTTGLLLIDQYNQAGQTSKAIDLASTLSEKLTRYGQAIQAVRILDKFSPARQLVVASKIYDKYHPGETIPPEIADSIIKEAESIQSNIDTVHKVSSILDKVSDPFIKDKLIEGLQNNLKKAAASKIKLAKTIENFSPWRKFQKKLAKLNILRAIEASVDLSAAGRQGMIFSLSHPLASAKAFYRQLQALRRNPEAYKEFEQQYLYSDAMYDFARQAGIDFTSASASGLRDLTKAEEAFMTGLFEDLAASDSNVKRALAFPIIRSEQAYVTFLNHQRLSVFKLYSNALLRAGIPTHSRVEFQAIDRATGEIITKAKTREELSEYSDNPAYQIKDASIISKDYKYMADFINKATGRGNLGKGRIAGAAPFLNSILFSPKYVASRFQLLAEPIKLLTPKSHLKLGSFEVPHPTNKISGKLRYLIAKDLTIFAGAVAGSLILVDQMRRSGMDAEASLNPEDPDFLKARIGTAHYDLSGGFQGQLRVLFQLYNYFEDQPNLVKQGPYLREKGTGEYRKTGKDIAYEFIERKLAPIPGFAVGAISGKSKDYDKLGKRLDFEREPELPFLGKVEALKGTSLERPAGYWNEFSKMFAPITIRDFYQAYQDEGVKGLVKSAPGVLGVGTQVYKKKK